MRTTMLAALMVWGTAGCATGGGESDLRARAAYDLRCPPQSLSMTQLQEANFLATTNHGAAYGVAGCGRRATYVNNVGAWVLNNHETIAEPGQPAPASAPPPAPRPASADTRL